MAHKKNGNAVPVDRARCLWRRTMAATLIAGLVTLPAYGQGTSPGQGHLIGRADIKAWNEIMSSQLSNDGKWFVYIVGPEEGPATLVIRQVSAAATDKRVAIGCDGRAATVQISDDSKWVAYNRCPGGNQVDTGAIHAAAPVTRGSSAEIQLVVENLETGDQHVVDHIGHFDFTRDGEWIVMDGAQGPSGGLMLYRMATGEVLNLGVVGQSALSTDGMWLAYTRDTPGQVGNSVQLFNMRTRVVRSLESEPVIYRDLKWIKAGAGEALSVVREKLDTVAHDTTVSVEAFAGVDTSGGARVVRFDPAQQASFPHGWRIAADVSPRFSDDLSVVFFNTRPVSSPSPVGKTDSTNRSTVVVWNAKDPRLQSLQKSEEAYDRNISYLAEYRFGAQRFIQLADAGMPRVHTMVGDRYAYGISDTAYQLDNSFSHGRPFADVYVIDLATGARRLVQRKRWTGDAAMWWPGEISREAELFKSSPDGTRGLYWGTDGQYWVMNMATGDTVNITKNVPVRFVSTEDDHPNPYPPSAYWGRYWTKDGSAVLICDGWDVWKVPVVPGSGHPVNLTGDGKAHQIHYGWDLNALTVSGERGPNDASTAGIDLSKPLYLKGYGEWTKREGFAVVNPGQPGAKPLITDSASFGAFLKARDADVYLYTRERFNEYPNYWVFGPAFAPGYRLTDANPQMRDLAWSSGSQLVDYRSEKGDRLQGALYLPANYQPGKKYPLLVFIYEKRSFLLHRLVTPSDGDTPNTTLFTDRGYAVLDADIDYRLNDPGMSAVWCVVPAVKAAIATGVVDPKRVGLWGHSFGGYETDFIVTQTHIFSAAVAGAGITEMFMDHSKLWGPGVAVTQLLDQFRMRGDPAQYFDAYVRNSPIFHVQNVTTPLLIEHNDQDDAVMVGQGLAYYLALRQLKKPVVWLEYMGEGHGEGQPANQRDFAVRVTEWFDHYLKGEPAPAWISQGIPWSQMDKERSRANTADVP